MRVEGGGSEVAQSDWIIVVMMSYNITYPSQGVTPATDCPNFLQFDPAVLSPSSAPPSAR